MTLITLIVWFGTAGVQDPVVEQQREFIRCSLGSLYSGILAEDPEVIAAFLYADNDPDRVLAKAHADRIIANMRFLRAVKRLNIGHGSTPFAEFRIFLPDDYAFALLTGEWEIQGNSATKPASEKMGNEGPAPPLINVRGVWKVNVTPSPRDGSTAELARQIAEYAKIVEQTAKELDSGKLTTVQEAANALRRAPQFGSSDYTPDLILSLKLASARHPATSAPAR